MAGSPPTKKMKQFSIFNIRPPKKADDSLMKQYQRKEVCKYCNNPDFSPKA